jgi:hypothetical protein
MTLIDFGVKGQGHIYLVLVKTVVDQNLTSHELLALKLRMCI